jgi:hypothetical protein
MGIEEEPEASKDRERLAWHPAFFEAIQMELDEYGHELQFISEYQLTTEPLRIDVVIIRKSGNAPIEKNIAAIFRKENIVEYKSPDDYVSVGDYYLVYGYACLYAALNHVGINELTVSFVESRYPRELLSHLREVRGYTVEERWPGVYIVSGDILPIQIIDSRKLSEEENLWLKGLDNRLSATEVQRIADEAEKQGKGARIRAYLDVILRANAKVLQELYMSGTITLEKVIEDIGLAAKWEARGKAEGEARGEEKNAAEIAKNMLRSGISMEQTATLSGLDIDKVKLLAE